MFKIWHSTESFADYIIDHTDLKNKCILKKKIFESDANNSKYFHTMPDHIKKILYLDAPDLIVEYNTEPIFSIEISSEAGTGHNVFQRFARLAASIENEVPILYIYPEAVIIKRRNTPPRWDKINPLIFKALDDAMTIYEIPVLLYYFPSDFKNYMDSPEDSPNYRTKGLNYDSNIQAYPGCPNSNDTEMQNMFVTINQILAVIEKDGIVDGRRKLNKNRTIMNRRNFINAEYLNKKGQRQDTDMSPLSATIKIDTSILINYLTSKLLGHYGIGELLKSRKKTIIYKINANFRGDPYPGALAAIDYLSCREGKTFEERKYNLVLAWGDVDIDNNLKTLKITNSKNITIKDFVKDVKNIKNKMLLSKNFNELKSHEIPRYYMQVRYGSMFSKVKHIRIYAYFADAILFPDGFLWRDG